MVIIDYSAFLDEFLEKIEELEIDISQYELDHLGYQCSSTKDYENKKYEFLGQAKLLDEKVIGGRRVGFLKLYSPIKYKNRNLSYTINALELIEPKANQKYTSALEHGEFIIKESFDDFMRKYPAINWDTSSINQQDFPMIKLRLGTQMQVKFHYEHILDIINKLTTN